MEEDERKKMKEMGKKICHFGPWPGHHATCPSNAYSACHVSPRKWHISFFIKLTTNFNG
jgi:hypothetical protein